MANVRLPVIQGTTGSIQSDGRRKRIYPADVRGRFARARGVAFAVLIVLWAALPWIRIHGAPAVFLDVEARKFFLFGATFNAQDAWLLFFLLTGVGFGLVYITAIAGRAWCGWACPQTVFLEGVYRRIERWIDGPREVAMRRAAAGWTFARLLRETAKHGAFVLVSLLIAHIVLSYFVSLPRAFEMVRHSPAEHPEAFAWVIAITALLYGNFAWFREQLCVVLCPYGRLQSVLLDDDSLVVGYDVKRGEPRGKAHDPNAGDCVDCKRCVVVCPTGIDIREGLQLDCLACTACIDACDDIMDKLGRPRGLIRYDSQNGLADKPKRFVRPRLVLYTVLLVAGGVAASFAFRARTDFEVVVTRLPGEPYTIDGGDLRNALDLHIVNKRGGTEAFDVVVDATDPQVKAIVPMTHVSLGGLTGMHVPVFLTMPRDRFQSDVPVRVRVVRAGTGGQDTVAASATFLGAKR